MPAVKLRLAVLVVSFVFGPALVWKGPLWKTVITFGTAVIALTLLVAAIDTIPNGEIRGGREHWSGLRAAHDHAFMRPTAIGAIIVTTAIGASRLHVR